MAIPTIVITPAPLGPAANATIVYDASDSLLSGLYAGTEYAIEIASSAATAVAGAEGLALPVDYYDPQANYQNVHDKWYGTDAETVSNK